MESLAVILQSLRLDSTVLSLAHLSGEWGVSTRGAPGVILHGVLSGRCFVERADAPGEHVELGPGEMVALPRGEAHTLRAHPKARATPITALPNRPAGSTRVLEFGTAPGQAPETRILCGLARLDHPAARGLVDLLPPVLVARGKTPAQVRWIESTLLMAEEEALSGGSQLRSLVDALFVRALVQAAEAGTAPSGLLAAARDEKIGRALAFVHTQPSGTL